MTLQVCVRLSDSKHTPVAWVHFTDGVMAITGDGEIKEMSFPELQTIRLKYQKIAEDTEFEISTADIENRIRSAKAKGHIGASVK